MSGKLEHITSTSNPAVKFLKSLDRKKNRSECGLFLAEGARLVREGVARGWKPHTLLLGDEASREQHLKTLVDEALSLGARVLTCTPKVLGAVARKDNPQTVIAAFHQRNRELTDLDIPSKVRLTALYEVRDPGNLGTILRTGDACGVGAVILIDQCCDPYSVECVRATMGSIFATPFVQCSYDAFSRWRTKSGFRLVAASVNGSARHDEIAYGDKSILLMGNEQSGLPAQIESECDQLVRIPMTGAADSLNLAQATAVVTYQIWKEYGYVGAR